MIRPDHGLRGDRKQPFGGRTARQGTRSAIRTKTLNSEDVDSVPEALKELTAGRGPDACIDAVGMEAHYHGPAFAYDRVKQAMRQETELPIALREAIMRRRNGGIVSVIGVYGGLMDKFPIGGLCVFVARVTRAASGSVAVESGAARSVRAPGKRLAARPGGSRRILAPPAPRRERLTIRRAVTDRKSRSARPRAPSVEVPSGSPRFCPAGLPLVQPVFELCDDARRA